MQFSIKIGDMYLQEIIVNSGFKGHTQLGTNETKSIVTSFEPKYFSSSTVGNKVKEVIELMRYKDVELCNITIIPTPNPT